MSRRRYRSASGVAEAYPASSLLRLWILRLLVLLDGRKEFLRDKSFSNDALASAIGLEKWLESERDFVEKEVNAELHKLHL